MKEQQELESKLKALDRELEADSFSFPGRFPGRVWTLGARCALLYALGRLESLELARKSETTPPPCPTLDLNLFAALSPLESVRTQLEQSLRDLLVRD